MKIMNKLPIFFLLLFISFQTAIAQKAASKNYTFLLQSKPSRTLSGGIKVEKSSDAMAFSIFEIPIGLAKAESFITFSLRLNGSNFSEEAIDVSFSENQKDWKTLSHFHENTEGFPSVWIGELQYLDKNTSKIYLKIKKKDKKTVLSKAVVRFFNPGVSTSTGGIPLNTRSGGCLDQPPSSKRVDWGATLSLSENIYSGSPSFTTVTHVIVHHSAGGNTSSDWDGVVRSILDFHVNSNGWADVGYNWLIAPTGKLYVGRGGGNNVVGAHYCAKNGNTMGICMLGTYTTFAPTDTALRTLEKIISWKCLDANINPLVMATHVAGNIKTIEGHRSGCSTECPGDMTYSLLDNIRTNVSKIVNSCKSTSYDDLGGSHSIKIYPNPNNGFFQIEFSQPISVGMDLQLTDVSGRVVLQKKYNTNEINQALSIQLPQELSNGIYLLNLKNADLVATKKIIIER
jgi:N-acetylmuramoyl-L-alanine amidase/Secretion system C-terminal sorting domain